MAESNRVVSRLMSFILLFDCQEAFHCCLVVACSNRINMISIQCHRVGEWSAGKAEFEKVSIPVWGNHDYAGLNEVHIPFKLTCDLNICSPRNTSCHPTLNKPEHFNLCRATALPLLCSPTGSTLPPSTLMTFLPCPA